MAVTLDFEGSADNLNRVMNGITQRLEGIAQGYEEIQDVSKKAIGGAVKDQDRLETATDKSTAALRQYDKTVIALENHLGRLETAQKKASDPRTIRKYNDEIAKTSLALQTVRKSGVSGLNAVNKSATASRAIFASLRSTIATTFAPILLGAGVVEGIQAIVRATTEFEQSAADLSSITGATGDTLEFLKQTAVEVGVETTISANDTIDAYRLIASAKPELLENAEALASITREAVTLTEAMGGELPKAATDLTDIMNQFNASAEEAPRFVNALAAGSKEGSADVSQLAAAIVVAGTSARTSNVQFEESIGLLETLAERGVKGSEAGTALRNVLSRLSATDVLPQDAVDRLTAAGVDIDLLSDKTLTFSDRLRALAPIQNDANALTSLFGLENQAAGQILLENVDRVDELTAAVTGTNVAYEQAEVRTKTVRAEFQRLRNTVVALIQSGGDGFNSFLITILAFARNGVLFLRDTFNDLRPTFDTLVSSLSGFVQLIRNALPATQDAAGGVTLWGQAIKIINVPIKLLVNLLSILINSITAVGTGFSDIVQESPLLQRVFNRIRSTVQTFIGVFLSLPGILTGSVAAIRSFAVDTISAVRTLGNNVASVLSEAFNIPKLIRQGAGDLRAALREAAVNPFKGIGSNAAQAFNEAFEKTQAAAPPKVKIDAPAGSLSGGGSSDSTPNPSTGLTPKEQQQAEKRAKELEKQEQEIARLRLSAMQDGLDKQLALEDARFTDLKGKLEKFNLDTEQATFQHELNKFEIRQKFLADAADLEGLTGEERINFFRQQTENELNAIEAAIRASNAGALPEEQARQLNLLRKTATEQYLEQINALQQKEQEAALQHEINLLELQRDGFDSQKDFEEFKGEEILKIRLRYAEAQLALLRETQGAESDAALALQGSINSLKGQIAELDSQGTATEFSFARLIGLDPDDPSNGKIIEGINAAAATASDVLSSINDLRLQTADEAVRAADKEIESINETIDAKRKQIDEEQALGEEGFANNVDRLNDEILLLEEQRTREEEERQKALEQKKRIQRQQAIIDTITQGQSLITAAAQIFQSVATIPFAGPAIGAALVAAMIGSFAAAKIKVFQNINKQTAEKGMTGIVTGNRHTDGGERFGDHIEVESGEAFGVLSRKATKQAGKKYLDFTNALNKGDRASIEKAAAAFLQNPNLDHDAPTQLGMKANNFLVMNAQLRGQNNTKELKENNALLRQILKEQKKQPSQIITGPNKRVERVGNRTRIIKNK